MSIKDAIKKIIGNIIPASDTNIDDRRYENLQQHSTVTQHLIQELIDVANLKDSKAYSVSRAGKYAHRELKDIAILLRKYTDNNNYWRPTGQGEQYSQLFWK